MPINLLKGRLVTYFKSQFNGENWVLETNYRNRNIFFRITHVWDLFFFSFPFLHNGSFNTNPFTIVTPKHLSPFLTKKKHLSPLFDTLYNCRTILAPFATTIVKHPFLLPCPILSTTIVTVWHPPPLLLVTLQYYYH